MIKIILSIFIAVIIAFSAGWYFSNYASKANIEDVTVTVSSVEKNMIYTCPMHPHILDEHEGDCPICGMSLVEQEVDSNLSAENIKAYPEVFIDSAVINNFGIKTTRVTRENISKNIRIYGYINNVKKLDLISIKSPVSGTVRYINKSFESNKFYKNEVVIALESDEVLKLQKLYLESVSSKNLSVSRQLKQKLSKLGFTFHQLKELVNTGKASNVYKIRYPDTGLLIKSKIKLKQKVHAGQVVAEFQPVYSVSAVSKVYESQWIWLKVGQKIEMRIRSLPGIVWNGEVRRVDDLGQSSTTAVKLFADFEENSDVSLRLGMQTEMTVFAETKEDVLMVPASAVINTGTRTVVVLAKPGGYFQPVNVVTGLENDEYIEILSGLKEGMKIVVAGQFLLDSESELKAEIVRMQSSTHEASYQNIPHQESEH